ncbi:Hypothetical_protein [Hexamita inflata]|uniref:Hypothetical_protein n=1 Tax=Hexamita inflata TaxID=28002 RepID=A0AA86U1W3_9EUKA|nr:Hypothetical protein HINF_LOCUS24809 [Hexamita inflata]
MCKNDDGIENFTDVLKRSLLQKKLEVELDVNNQKKSRIGAKHTNRVHITEQLKDETIKQLHSLAKVIVQMMLGEVDNVEQQFQQVYDFWQSIRGGIIFEWCVKKSNKRFHVNEMTQRNIGCQSCLDKYTQVKEDYILVNGKAIIDTGQLKQDKSLHQLDDFFPKVNNLQSQK